MLPQTDLQDIAIAIKVLKARYNELPTKDDGRGSPFGRAFGHNMPDNRTIFSAVGLGVVLEQKFILNVANILSRGYKREFTKHNGTSLRITKAQQQTIYRIVSDLREGKQLPDTKPEDGLLIEAGRDDEEEVEVPDIVVDNFADNGHSIEAIFLRFVPAYTALEDKHDFLNAKAAMRRRFPDNEVSLFIGFPFDLLPQFSHT